MTTRSVFIEQLASIASLQKSNTMTQEEAHLVEQRVLAKLLALLQDELKVLSHLQPMPESPYTMEDVYDREKWIEQQKALVSIVEGLQSRAKKVDHSLALSPPYDEKSIEEAKTSLADVEQHWKRCATLERNWIRIGREHTLPRSISLFDLDEEEREYQLQKAHWERYQSLEKKYLELKHPLTKLRYPFEPAVLDKYEEQYQFTVKWMEQIAQHKRVLLTRFHDQIDFPQLPFSSQDIVEYSKKVRPLLQSSTFLKYYAPLITICSLVLAYFAAFVMLQNRDPDLGAMKKVNEEQKVMLVVEPPKKDGAFGELPVPKKKQPSKKKRDPPISKKKKQPSKKNRVFPKFPSEDPKRATREGWIKLEDREYESAKPIFEDVIKIEPNLEAFLGLGFAEEQLAERYKRENDFIRVEQQYDQAHKSYCKAMEYYSEQDSKNEKDQILLKYLQARLKVISRTCP